jgi:hypothetical protein
MATHAAPETNLPLSVCTQCGRANCPVHQCSLIGIGDHPRKFLLCDACIKQIVGTSPTIHAAASSLSPIMSDAEKRQETRRQKAFERLGTDHPICPFCGEDDWRCMELHHLEGEHFGKTLITVCRNCHRKLSDSQKDHQPKFGRSPGSLEKIAHALEGLADLFVLLAQKLKEFATHLIEEARSRVSGRAPSRT